MGVERERAMARWELVMPHRATLVRVARSRGLAQADAEECVQEAMLRCVEFERLDESRVLQFLVTTTTRLCTDYARRHVRDRRLAVKLTSWDAEQASPEDEVCERAEAAWLADQLGGLPEWQRDVLAARADGLDTTEVASRFGVSYKAIESQLYRIRTRARGMLAATLGTAFIYARRVTPPRAAVLTSAVAAAAVTILVTHGSGGGPARQPAVPFQRVEQVVATSGPPAARPAPTTRPRPALVTPPPTRPSASPSRRATPEPSMSCPVDDAGMCLDPTVGESPDPLKNVRNCLEYGLNRSHGVECATPTPTPSRAAATGKDTT